VSIALNVLLVIGILGYFGVETTSFAALIAALGIAIGLFTTAIDAPDNVITMVGNAKIMNGTIKNYSYNPFRRVDLTAQLDHSVDVQDAVRRLKEILPTIANVMQTQAPDVEIMAFNERGPVLAVRPYVHTNHNWQVYFDTNRVIRDTFGAAGYPTPEAHIRYRTA
jgi:small conductance mechanosensitive channel